MDKENTVFERKSAEESLYDPAIREQWDRLTERSKEMFLKYFEPSAEQLENETV